MISLYFLAHPEQTKKLPDLPKRVIQYYYTIGRNTIQYQYAVYNPSTTYRLKPGKFQFSNTEFKTNYSVNSHGFRDDEESLFKPEIIVLGDSFAMGWGVEQNEAFAQLIERRSKRKVLNTAVSSFGTIRELTSLKELDLNRTKFIIIQYWNNDFGGNKVFIDNGMCLPIKNEEQYESTRRTVFKNRKYFIGNYSIYLYYYITVFNIRNYFMGKIDRTNEAKYFLKVLSAYDDILRGKKIIIVIIEDDIFFNELKEDVKGDYPNFIKGINIINMKNLSSHFLALDGHLDAEGHKLIADKIMEVVNKNGKK